MILVACHWSRLQINFAWPSVFSVLLNSAPFHLARAAQPLSMIDKMNIRERAVNIG